MEGTEDVPGGSPTLPRPLRDLPLHFRRPSVIVAHQNHPFRRGTARFRARKGTEASDGGGGGRRTLLWILGAAERVVQGIGGDGGEGWWWGEEGRNDGECDEMSTMCHGQP